jgi:hypothetical protein
MTATTAQVWAEALTLVGAVGGVIGTVGAVIGGLGGIAAARAAREAACAQKRATEIAESVGRLEHVQWHEDHRPPRPEEIAADREEDPRLGGGNATLRAEVTFLRAYACELTR